MSNKPMVQVAADELEILLRELSNLQKDMKYRRIGRAKAYLAMTRIRDDISRLAGRLGAL